MDRIYLLLCLPALIQAQISISINASDTTTPLSISFHGFASDVISDIEQESFGITDIQLKNGVERYSGGRPHHVFIKSPTPWNDLYLTYGWHEVTRTLKPVRSRVITSSSEVVVVSSDRYINRSNLTSFFTASALKEVVNSVSGSWERGRELTGSSIDYNVYKGLSSHSYTSSWGQNWTNSHKVRLGSTGVPVTVKPGDGVIVALAATRKYTAIQVDYEAKLRGVVATNFLKKYLGHHFWSYNVINVMQSLNLPTTLVSRETLRIGFYCAPKLIVADKNSRKIITEVPVDITSVS